ncbi:hypothetical protein BD410DRAFT_714964 [Rickenella mellea]|uniref:Uncharacterized protein n=1 Tax=Rickenella mellea TaxID=50990 RepID=A0A4Y7QHB6_9AGAM|nr:hypothetical protein BD410DRAFT_714964 [Rickenella mellea]
MPPLLLPHDAPSASARGGPPRPWTPSSLNGTHSSSLRNPQRLTTHPDVDLTAAHEQGSAPPRRYPAPPTGHDLMALFPPVPPATIKDPAGALPTSGWFERQERAFFARAGAEIVRVRKDGAQPQEKRATQPQDAHSRSPPNPHAQSYPGGKQEPSEDGYDDPEEAWRKPMPHAERRRAGKHTKRVIVRT